MLEFKSRVLQFKFNETIHKVNYPSVKQLKSFGDGYDKVEDKVGLISDLIVELGMNKESCDMLELDMLEQILTELTVSKK